MSTFLTAEWRHLLSLSYAVDPSTLSSRVPPGTELDSWNGKTYVSVIGFLFLDTAVLGVPVPFHGRFEEVNVRFYVKRETNSGVRHGAVFIQELVPKHAVAALARGLFHEPYSVVPMSHEIVSGSNGVPSRIEYRWRAGNRWHAIRADVKGEPSPIVTGTEEEFLASRRWGYTALGARRSREYEVERPSWRICSVNATLEGDLSGLCGAEWSEVFREPPTSAFLADGSRVRLDFGHVFHAGA